MENGSNRDQKDSRTRFLEGCTPPLIGLVVGAVSILIVLILIRGPLLTFVLDKDSDPPTANDAQLVLSFIEAASVFVTIAGIAAAIFGVQKITDIGQEQEKVSKQIEAAVIEINKQVQKVNGFEATFDELQRQFADKLNTALANSKIEVEKVIENLNQINKWTQQAVHEMQLGNFKQAHQFAAKVVELDTYKGTQNIEFPLYLMAWLEIHHLQGTSLDNALQHFEELLKINPDWPTAQAGYGVALRRKARALVRQNSDTKEIKIYYANAEYHLRRALQQEPYLADPNRESYWGPLGGLLRDTERYEDAIEAYNEALKVTPKSSYPQGNMAALLLWRASKSGDQDWSRGNLAIAKRAFEKTLEFAKVELLQSPGDYFNLMDIAMAETILGLKASDGVTLGGEESLNLALQTGATSIQLRISVEQGWKFILDHYPDGESNASTRQAIADAIKKIEARIAEIESKTTPENSPSNPSDTSI